MNIFKCPLPVLKEPKYKFEIENSTVLSKQNFHTQFMYMAVVQPLNTRFRDKNYIKLDIHPTISEFGIQPLILKADTYLLVSNPHSKFTTIKCKIRHESTGPILHPNSLVLRIRGHDEVNVDQRCGLGDLPVDSGCSRRCRCRRRIDHKIPYLTEEVILINVPILTIS